MGGTAAALMGVLGVPSDNVVAVVPMGSNGIGQISMGLTAAVMYGGATGDTLNTPLSGLLQYGDNSIVPTFGHILRGGAHLLSYPTNQIYCDRDVPTSCHAGMTMTFLHIQVIMGFLYMNLLSDYQYSSDLLPIIACGEAGQSVHLQTLRETHLVATD